MDSELKDMEMIAEMADGKLVVRPSRLVYDASVAMDVFDENGNLVTPDRHVLNTELAGTITFRLAIPKTVTETYAQVVHKSAGYYDSNIRNLVIQNKVRIMRISLLKSATSASLISHLQTPK